MKKIYGLGEVKFKGLDDDGTFTAVVSGIKTDRYGDTIDPKGWDLKNFKKNPVLLWAHDHSIPTIGKAIKVWVEEEMLMLKGEFAPTPFASELKLLTEKGFLKAFSVGFAPTEYEPNDKGIDFTKQELLEVSFVNVGAYAEALMKGVSKDKKKYKHFIKETEGTLNWDKIVKSDDRKKLRKTKKIVFTAKEFKELEAEMKTGKVLSKRNRDLINNAIGAMDKATVPLKSLLKATEANKGKDADKKGRAVKPKAKTVDTEKAKSELIKIARSAIEAVLIKSRKDNK